MCVRAFISLLPESWRGNAFSLDTLFLSVISQMDELQWKYWEGRDGNLFTYFHILEAVGLTSVCCCGGKPLCIFSMMMAKPYFQFQSCCCWGAAQWQLLIWNCWSAEECWPVLKHYICGLMNDNVNPGKLLKSFNGTFGIVKPHFPLPTRLMSPHCGLQ